MGDEKFYDDDIPEVWGMAAEEVREAMEADDTTDEEIEEKQTKRKPPKLAEFSADVILSEAKLQRVQADREKLEVALSETEDADEKETILQRLALGMYRETELARTVEFGALSDEKLGEQREESILAAERGRVEAAKLIAEGFPEDSLTYAKANQAITEARAATDRIEMEQARRVSLIELEKLHNEQALELARETWRAEREAAYLRVKNSAAEPWELMKAQAEMEVPLEQAKDLKERMQTALATIQERSQARRMERFVDSARLKYGVQDPYAEKPRDTWEQRVAKNEERIRSMIEKGEVGEDEARRLAFAERAAAAAKGQTSLTFGQGR